MYKYKIKIQLRFWTQGLSSVYFLDVCRRIDEHVITLKISKSNVRACRWWRHKYRRAFTICSRQKGHRFLHRKRWRPPFSCLPLEEGAAPLSHIYIFFFILWLAWCDNYKHYLLINRSWIPKEKEKRAMTCVSETWCCSWTIATSPGTKMWVELCFFFFFFSYWEKTIEKVKPILFLFVLPGSGVSIFVGIRSSERAEQHAFIFVVDVVSSFLLHHCVCLVLSSVHVR